VADGAAWIWKIMEHHFPQTTQVESACKQLGTQRPRSSRGVLGRVGRSQGYAKRSRHAPLGSAETGHSWRCAMPPWPKLPNNLRGLPADNIPCRSHAPSPPPPAGEGERSPHDVTPPAPSAARSYTPDTARCAVPHAAWHPPPASAPGSAPWPVDDVLPSAPRAWAYWP